MRENLLDSGSDIGIALYNLFLNIIDFSLTLNHAVHVKLGLAITTDENNSRQHEIHDCPANTWRLPNAGLMLGQRRLRWPNIKPASVNVSCLMGV